MQISIVASQMTRMHCQLEPETKEVKQNTSNEVGLIYRVKVIIPAGCRNDIRNGIIHVVFDTPVIQVFELFSVQLGSLWIPIVCYYVFDNTSPDCIIKVSIQ